MPFRGSRVPCLFVVMVLAPIALNAQESSPSSSSSSKKNVRKLHAADSALDAGVVSDGVYGNKTLGLSCKIPAGWVLRTEEMNAREEDEPAMDWDIIHML